MGASICADPAAMAADNGSLPLTENCGNWVGICPAADFRIALAASSSSVSTFSGSVITPWPRVAAARNFARS
jgi:hypothetical protein